MKGEQQGKERDRRFVPSAMDLGLCSACTDQNSNRRRRSSGALGQMQLQKETGEGGNPSHAM